MALAGRAYSAQAKRRITGIYNPNAPANTHDVILRIPYADLPSGQGGEYSVVAICNLGNFRINTGDTAFAKVFLRWDGASPIWQPETQSRIDMQATQYHEGSLPNAATGHMVCWRIPAGQWQTNTDLTLAAHVEATSFSAPPSFGVGDATLLLIDHTVATAFAYSVTSTIPLGPATGSPTQILAPGSQFPWTSGSNEWLVFSSTQGQALSSAGVYSCWSQRHPTASWVSADSGYGIDGVAGRHGMRSRTTLPATYSMGYWWPTVVDNATTDVRLLGVSHHTGAASQVTYAAVVGIRLDDLDDAYTSTLLQVANGFSSDLWESFQTRVVDAGADRAQYVALGVTTPRDTFGGNTPISHYVRNVLRVNGFPTAHFELDALNSFVIHGAAGAGDSIPVFGSHVTYDPWLTRQGANSIIVDGLVSPWLPGSAREDTAGESVSIAGFSLTTDGDWADPPPPVIAYTPITLAREISIASVPAMTVVPDSGYQIERLAEGTVFRTDDGHVIAWPKHFAARRRWSVQWTVLDGEKALLDSSLYVPTSGIRAVRIPAAVFAGGTDVVGFIEPGSTTAELIGGQTWRVTAVLTELIYKSA